MLQKDELRHHKWALYSPFNKAVFKETLSYIVTPQCWNNVQSRVTQEQKGRTRHLCPPISSFCYSALNIVHVSATNRTSPLYHNDTLLLFCISMKHAVKTGSFFFKFGVITTIAHYLFLCGIVFTWLIIVTLADAILMDVFVWPWRLTKVSKCLHHHLWQSTNS